MGGCSNQEVTEKCQRLRLGSSIFLLAFLPLCRIHVRLITRHLILHPYRSLQQLLEGQGSAHCSTEDLRGISSLSGFQSIRQQMGLCQSFPHPGLLSTRISDGKVFLCKSWSHLCKLQTRSLGRHPGSCGPGSLLVLCLAGSRIQFSAIRAVGPLQKLPQALTSLPSVCLNSGED